MGDGDLGEPPIVPGPLAAPPFESIFVVDGFLCRLVLTLSTRIAMVILLAQCCARTLQRNTENTNDGHHHE